MAYTETFKAQAVAYLVENGYAAATKKFQVSAQTLSTWHKAWKANTTKTTTPTVSTVDVEYLRSENALLREVVASLSKVLGNSQVNL